MIFKPGEGGDVFAYLVMSEEGRLAK